MLVTGGTGVLGGLAARHLVEVHGVRCVVLASRRGLGAAGAAELELSWRGLVRGLLWSNVMWAIVAGRGVAWAGAEEFPLGGVVHAAGALDDGVIGSLSLERFDGVFASEGRCGVASA